MIKVSAQKNQSARAYVRVKSKTTTDKGLLITMFSLLVFGLIVIANSTVIYSNSLYSDPYRFVFLQLGWIILGLGFFYLFYKLDYKHLEKVSFYFFIINLIFLLVLAIIGLFPCNSEFAFAPCVNGANRWFYLNPPPFPKIPFLGVIGFQPGEMAKLTLTMYLATQLKAISEGKKTKIGSFYLYLLSTGITSALILLQPNMSTAVMVMLIGTIVYFCSGQPIKNLFVLLPALAAAGVAGIMLSPYRRSRLMTLLDKGGDDTSLTLGYHMKQILIALGSGGLWGVGFGQSRQKYSYLPEVASDSIFAVIGEELGYVGVTVLMLVYGFLIFKGLSIAKRSDDLLGRLLAVGITSWLGLQFVVNVAAMAKIIPLTGVPIPLISYGGSSMIFSLIGLGILANISKR